MVTKLVDDLRGVRLKLNPIKSELTIVNHIKEEESQPLPDTILRSFLEYSHMERLENFVVALVAALKMVTNIRFEENSLAQEALPIRLGGLGIRMAKDIALAAFISSLLAVRKFVDGILNSRLLPESDSLSAAENVAVGT